MGFTRAASNPTDGLKNTSAFPTYPSSESSGRKQFQDVIDKVNSDVNVFEGELEATGGAGKVGCTGAHSNVQDFITATEAAGSGTTPGASVITDNMMVSDVKIGSLALLSTSIKTSVVNAINSIITLIGSLSSLYTSDKTSLINAINELNTAGEVRYFAMSTAPTGYLKANGAAVSRATYARLFVAIGITFGGGDGSTTFNLPDLRGVFPRGWDDSKGYDSGRAFGSYQADDNKAHTHSGTTNPGGSHNHTVSIYNNGGSGQPGMYQSTTGNQSTFTTTTAPDHTHGFTTASTGATETTVKNIALLACIKI